MRIRTLPSQRCSALFLNLVPICFDFSFVVRNRRVPLTVSNEPYTGTNVGATIEQYEPEVSSGLHTVWVRVVNLWCPCCLDNFLSTISLLHCETAECMTNSLKCAIVWLRQLSLVSLHCDHVVSPVSVSSRTRPRRAGTSSCPPPVPTSTPSLLCTWTSTTTSADCTMLWYAWKWILTSCAASEGSVCI
jgi:hypothetical protein